MRSERPGLVFLGFVVTAAPLIGVVAAYQTEAFAGAGWHGGQYAKAFVVGTAVAVVGGAALRVFGPGAGWPSVGRGMMFGAVAGFVIILASLALVAYALSHMRFV